jgi:hypothetical protein
MKRKEAVEVLHNALTSYVEDCAGANTPEAEEIQKAWDRIQEPTLNSDEEKDIKVILNFLDIDSSLYDTLLKVARGIGVKV